MDLNYTGWKRWKPTNDEWIDFYTDNKVPFEMKDGEYLILEGEDTVVSYYCFEGGKFRHCSGGSIKTGIEAPVEEEFTTGKGKKKYSKSKQPVITPRNDYQVCAFDLIKDQTKTIKLLEGRFGSGKTLILVTAALEALNNNVFERIIWVRNNVQVKDTPQLGALPGSAEEKLFSFLGPFRDHAGEARTRTMLTKGSLVVEPLQSLRGRNFVNSLIMCSECENLTLSQLQLIIARAGEGSAIWLDGDRKQFDANVFEAAQGIKQLVDIFSGHPLFGYVYLPKSERSATAAMADLLDMAVYNEKNKNKNKY